MRAITGAIITAGALIGLGLTALGLGLRYQNFGTANGVNYVRFSQLDTAMMVAVVVMLLSALVGMGTTFLGLAYHHERRQREHHLHTSGKTHSEV